MNNIPIDYWNPLHNYFIPSFKLESEQRVNSKVIKVYEFPKTYAQRIIDCENVKRDVKTNINSKLMHLKPIILKKELNKKLAIFTEMVENYIHQIAA